MGKMAIDALNSGNWYPDSDPENEEGRAAPDNRGGQFPLGGLSFFGLGARRLCSVSFPLPFAFGLWCSPFWGLPVRVLRYWPFARRLG